MDNLYSIGELARRTGLTVKAIRFWSDRGIVPPAGRSPAGYRRYGPDAVARLDLVRTLRRLGLDLDTVRRVVDREVPLAEVATAHAEALSVEIRTLRLRRAVLLAIAAGRAAPGAHRLAEAAEDEGRRLVKEFLDTMFGAVGGDPAFAGIRRSMTPELPEDPGAEQVEAWLELAELARDPDFRAGMRRMTEMYAADRAAGGGVCRRDAVALVREHAGPAVAAAVDPASSDAGAVVAAVTRQYAADVGRPDDAGLHRRLLARLAAAADPRRERYERLLAVVNGWVVPLPAAELDWFTRALRLRT